jgi:two-component system cell cycle sensor histidine kinase/response regulator CckA
VASARRRGEVADELDKHREHLEELVTERTAELETANGQLQLEISKRGRVESTLQEKETQYRDLVECALDGICIVQDEKLQFANQQLAEMLSLEVSAVVGSGFTDYVAPDSVESIVQFYHDIMSGKIDKERFEATLLTKLGRLLEVGMSASAIDYHGRRAVMVMVRDIAEQKRVRRVALENERLEAVGIVAQGVGNNFTNIMSVISSYAASIADSFLPHTRPHNAARKILDASRHASDLTQRLLSVVRVDGPHEQTKLEPVSLSRVIEKARGLVDSTLNARGVTVVIKKANRLPYVMADQSQLLDTLMNIFLNGSDAMPEGGTLRIACIERNISKPRTNSKATGGTFVGLSVQDTGVGMSKEQVSRVFEPFFTTKDASGAFGLGLPVAQSMAQSWGGWIDVRSRVGKGTRVRVFMSKAERPADADEAVLEGPLAVLVVDDNPGRLQLMTQALTERGHKVFEATGCDDAIQLHKEHAADIDLSVIDWLMPEKDGKGVLQAVLDHDPQSKVIMISGFSRDYVRSELRMGAWGFLQKPFSADEFVEAVESHAPKSA